MRRPVAADLSVGGRFLVKENNDNKIKKENRLSKSSCGFFCFPFGHFQTQVPCLVGGCGFRFRTHELLSLQSNDFCWDMSINALAIARPDCPGGGTPLVPLGKQRKTVRTAALFPQHGSMAIGFGTPSTGARKHSTCSAPTSSVTSTEAKGRLAIC